MDTQQIDEKSVFNAARRITDAAARENYVAQACGDDTQAIQRIRELLRIHAEQQSFLETPPAALAATTASRLIAEQPGAVIGSYKLLQQIGEGGMGVVFMAEQSEPIQRTVALKIIKPGMDTRQVIARFEAERQAVAMMDHPNIAKVLDAGATDSGRPYFVMELVKGVPITKYCDEKRLPVRARLELFTQVCQAVQHAHQKGLIHRDIKPNNVLVAEYDNQAVPKVIDFGVAKATAQKLTERTMFTEFGQVVGTMEYMSPEQAKLNQLDIDTRSDIYSLGVLLYELLTGSTPFGRSRLNEAAFDEMLRIIREEEPPKPSTRVSSSDTLPSIAADRHTEPARLSKDVRGELDWIVMKALEKDRNRRYETASSFAADIERHLHDEPVEAGPPSAAYRFRKFARRNKAALAVAAATLAVLFFSVLGLAISNRLIAAERNAKSQALAEKVRALAEKDQALSLSEAQRRLAYYMDAVKNNIEPAESMDIDDFGRQVNELLNWAASVPASSLTRGSVNTRASIGHRRRDLAFLLRHAGRLEMAELTFMQAVRTFEELRNHDPGTAGHWHYLADTHREVGLVQVNLDKTKEAEQEFRRAIDVHEQRVARFPDEHLSDAEWSLAYFDLARLLVKTGRMQEALPLVTRGVSVNPSNDGRAAETQIQLKFGSLLRQAHDFDRAVELFSKAIAVDPNLAAAWLARGECRAEMGQLDLAADDFATAVKLGPDRWEAWAGRAWASFQRKQWEAAIADYSRAIDLAPKIHSNWYHRGLARMELGEWDNAVADLTKVVEGWPTESDGWYLRCVAFAQTGHPDRAIADLRQAVAKGYSAVGQLKSEPKLAPLRLRTDFIDLLALLEVQEKQRASQRP